MEHQEQHYPRHLFFPFHRNPPKMADSMEEWLADSNEALTLQLGTCHTRDDGSGAAGR
jgi:hypothetical protein